MSQILSPQTTVPYQLIREGILMQPESGNPLEAEGVLNPATARASDGTLRLFARLVAAGNYSRVGTAHIEIHAGRPVGVHRDGVALEPERSWEYGLQHGGTEDPRITTVAPLGLHVMTYVAFGPTGPRPALAVSEDAETWTRLGPIAFVYDDALGVDLNLYPNKDVVFFPDVVTGPDGTPSIAMLHRPMWDFSFTRPQEPAALPTGIDDSRPSIWISYIRLAEVQQDIAALTRPANHRLLAGPLYDWEQLKIGAGPPPVRTPEGWLLLHHGVSGEIVGSAFDLQTGVHYSVGAMLLDLDDPTVILARTELPLMSPELREERDGPVANVVFPTAIEEIDGTAFVFYGMADARIGVARLERTA